MKYRITKEYVAGFLDADGSVIMWKQKPKSKARPNNTNPQYQASIHFFNTNKTILELIKSKYGGYLRKRVRSSSSFKTQKAQYELRMKESNDAQAFGQS